jgi:predicted acylesterase/phospholipase RssA
MLPKRIRELYQACGKDVFAPRDFLDRLSSLDEITRANYSPEPLKKAIEGTFGEKTVGGLSKSVLVPAMNLSLWKTKFFDNEDKDWCLWEVAMASGSAPTYFPAFCGPDGYWYCDGGIFANNPIDRAVTQAQILGYLLGEVVALSVGTGSFHKKLPRGEMDWGLYQWGIEPGALFPAIFDTPVMAASTSVAKLLGSRFHRIQPQLPREIDLADASAMDELVELADAVDLDHTLEWADANLLADRGAHGSH